MILTSNTEATENKVHFFNLAYRVKGFQCHSNNSPQLLGRKTTATTGDKIAEKSYHLGSKLRLLFASAHAH